jgi:hypothetical protein
VYVSLPAVKATRTKCIPGASCHISDGLDVCLWNMQIEYVVVL